MQEKEILKKLNELKDNEEWESLRIINNECAMYNGSTDEINVNDEEFFNIFFENNVNEAVRAVCFGDYRYTDGFVMFDAYGNLQSFNEYELKHYLDLDEMAYQITEYDDIYNGIEIYLDS